MRILCLEPKVPMYKPYVIYLCCNGKATEFGEYSNERLMDLAEKVSSNAYLICYDHNGSMIAAMFGLLEPFPKRIM